MIRKKTVVPLALFNMEENNEFISDDFNMVDSLNTTARQVIICFQIVRLLSEKQLPESLLKDLMLSWGSEQEGENVSYKNSKGKITNTSFKHYLKLCNSLGLISEINRFYANTRLGHLFLHFIKKENNTNNIGEIQKTLFSFLLLHKDTDGFLLILDMLVDLGETNQKRLQQEFKSAINNRLVDKKEVAIQTVKEIISEKYRTINFIWKNAEKYAEHVLIPRVEWLITLGWIEVNKKGSSSFYSLTNEGTKFCNLIPQIPATVTRDINQNWLFKNAFKSINIVNYDKNKSYFSELNDGDKNGAIGNALTLASKIVKSSNSFRIPLWETLLFICFEHNTGQKIITEIQDVLDVLRNGMIYNDMKFLIKEEARINESYISIRKI